MANAIALQPVWDCRWSRPGHRLTGVSDADQPESAWVCVREVERRNVTEAECQTCSSWELTPGGTVTASLTIPLAMSSERMTTAHLAALSTRGVLVLTALFFIAVGVVTLTGPRAVPFTVSMWLCAAAFAGLAVFWRPPET